MVGPQVVHGGETHQPFQIGSTLGFAIEHSLALFLQGQPLAFNGRFILVQKAPDLQILAFDQALNVIGLSSKQRVIRAVTHQQIVFERYKEARTSWVALAPGAPAELVVDAAALVAVWPPHPQAAPAGPAR